MGPPLHALELLRFEVSLDLTPKKFLQALSRVSCVLYRVRGVPLPHGCAWHLATLTNGKYERTRKRQAQTRWIPEIRLF